MKKASVFGLLMCVSAIVFIAACGSDSSSEPVPIPTSGIAKRVLVSSSFTGTVSPGPTFIIDGATDQLSTFTVNTVGRPTIMAALPAQDLAVVFEDLNNTLQFIDLTTEQVISNRTRQLPGTIENFALQSDGRFLYAPLRNLARIDKIDVVSGAATSITGLPQLRRVVLSPNNAKLLAFSEDSDSVTIIDTATDAKLPVTGFDRAFTAVFSPDSTRAFVLSCGAECGGTQAKVSVLDMTSNTIVGSVDVEGATVGLLDGNNLYVAGNRVGLLGLLFPRLNIVNITNLSVTQSPVDIHPGFHNQMALGANGRLFLGGNSCTACLTIYNTIAGTAVQGTQLGPVTSILPITNRSVVYVIENSDLHIYETSTDSLQANQVRIFGAVSVMAEAD